MKNLFLQFLNKPGFGNGKRNSFDEIIGHDGIKRIINNALCSKNPVHILLIGSPGTAKTMFLIEMSRLFKRSLFIVGSNTTKAGLLNRLFELSPKFLLVDELDKMTQNDQIALLHLMETGILSETKIGKSRQMELHSFVFATANNYKNIVEPLLSRFVVLEIPAYSYDEFREIAIARLSKENIDKIKAMEIADKVWSILDSRDIRDVVKVARLSTKDNASSIIRTLKTYNKKM